MNQLDNIAPMDVMYELVVEKIIEELSSRTRFEEGEIKEHWEEYVESRFYNAALTASQIRLPPCCIQHDSRTPASDTHLLTNFTLQGSAMVS